MNAALWIIAGTLALAYLIGGSFKALVPKERIAASGAAAKWVEDFSPAAVKGIGVVEILAAVGLVLPALLDTAPMLVPFAALGLVLLMSGAALTRLRRRELPLLVVDLLYIALAAFVVRGRFGPESFS